MGNIQNIIKPTVIICFRDPFLKFDEEGFGLWAFNQLLLINMECNEIFLSSVCTE